MSGGMLRVSAGSLVLGRLWYLASPEGAAQGEQGAPVPLSDVGSEPKRCYSGSEFKGEENSTLSLGAQGAVQGSRGEESVKWDVLLWPSKGRPHIQALPSSLPLGQPREE